ncbi:MAG: hypothetical protein WC325_09060 [Candidatus Bathyarchaeia archaeon]|jgi:hypothetical protein
MGEKRFLNKWKFSTAILVLALITVSFVLLYELQVQPYVAAQPSFIDVTIEGKGKLGVNETGQYTAVINSQVSSQLSISWTVTPEDNKVSLVVEGEGCSLTFLEATQEPYLLSVSVKDLVRGNLGSASKTVYDPYTSPSLYLSAFGAPYSYLIETDGLGWYRAVNGQTGAISWSSIDDDTVFTSVFATTPQFVYVKSGVYTVSLSIPAGTYLFAENSTTGISYTTIGDGARIDEPTFNSRYRGYEYGEFTVSVYSTTCLAFKSDNTIWYYSTNASYTVQSCINATPDGDRIIYLQGNSVGETTFISPITITNRNTLKIVFNRILLSGCNGFLITGGDANSIQGQYISHSTAYTTDKAVIITNSAANTVNINKLFRVGVEIVGDGGGAEENEININPVTGHTPAVYVHSLNSGYANLNIIHIGKAYHSIAFTTVKIEAISGTETAGTKISYTLHQASGLADEAFWNNGTKTVFLECTVADLGATGKSLVNSGTARIWGGQYTGVSYITNTEAISWSNALLGTGLTDNSIVAANSTATTFAITSGLAGNATGAWFSFDAATMVISDFKFYWTQTSSTVITVTVSGTSLPSNMTCYAKLECHP